MTTKIPAELSSTPGIVDNSDATAITIDSSENVGIGTSSPAEKLEVSGDIKATKIGMGISPVVPCEVLSTGATSTALRVLKSGSDDSTQNNLFSVTEISGHGRLSIHDSSQNEEIRFDSNGASFLSDGLSFDGTTTAASVLNDYEEGTFTPAYTATGLSVTHDNQTGLYTKIGDTVNFWILLGTDAKSGSSSSYGLTITGLPFTCLNNATSFVSGAVGLAYTWDSNVQSMKWFIGSNTSLIALYDGSSNVGGTITPAVMGTTSNDNRLYITGFYKTA